MDIEYISIQIENDNSNLNPEKPQTILKVILDFFRRKLDNLKRNFETENEIDFEDYELDCAEGFLFG